MESLLATHLARVAGTIVTTFGRRKLTREALRVRASKARTTAPLDAERDLVANLAPAEVEELTAFLRSPSIDEIALHVFTARVLARRGGDLDELKSVAREELRQSLKHNVKLTPDQLFAATEVLFEALLTASQVAWSHLDGDLNNMTDLDFTLFGHVSTSALRNSELLASLDSIAQFVSFEAKLRRQIAAMNRNMRLPHVGMSKSVPYSRLFIEPTITSKRAGQYLSQYGTASEVQLREAVETYRRFVILGDPGGGKSTLVAKLANEFATVQDRPIPFVVVLRDISPSLRDGGRTMVDHLEATCRESSNLEPPENAIEYALLNGRAFVVLDGLDELTDTSLRLRVVRLIESFAIQFPLVRILVTSRRIGYESAPLDPDLFDAFHLGEFSNEQVEQYATNWFAIDESVPDAQKKRLTDGFISDSGLVRDIRSNPLMLALLCGMYASERYIPRNRPEVYEKCALMLFERWDRMRGVSSDVDLAYGAQVRSAIQYLAWQLFTVPELGSSLPRRRIVAELAAGHYQSRRGNMDDAIQESERFVDFCIGRAWVLTDVGATSTEPRFGFVHRTFLEFFAAEYLVRVNDNSPDAVFVELRPHLKVSEWEVVAQLAVQMLDRNANRGADRFFESAFGSFANEASLERSAFLQFASRSLSYVVPSRSVVETIVAAAAAADLGGPLCSILFPSIFELSRVKPNSQMSCLLQELIGGSSRENLRDISTTLASFLRRALAEASQQQRRASYMLVWLLMLLRDDRLPRGAVEDELTSVYQEFAQIVDRQVPAVAGRSALSFSTACVSDIQTSIQRVGPRSLYVLPYLGFGTWCMWGLERLMDLDEQALDDLAENVEGCSSDLQITPWVKVSLFGNESAVALRKEIFGSKFSQICARADSVSVDRAKAMLVLLLPLLEYNRRASEAGAMPDQVVHALGRAGIASRVYAARYFRGAHSGAFDTGRPGTNQILESWMKGQFTTVGWF